MNVAKLVLILYVLLRFITVAFPIMMMMDFREESLENKFFRTLQSGTDRLIYQIGQENLDASEQYIFDYDRDSINDLIESLVIPPFDEGGYF